MRSRLIKSRIAKQIQNILYPVNQATSTLSEK
jgi:hypothetical protein